MRSRRAVAWAGLLLVLVATSGLSFCLGASSVGPRAALHALAAGPRAGHDDKAAQIVWRIRLPRLLLGFVVGAGLAVAGTMMQSFFQNPMADPYIVGVSSGAALGATAAIVLHWQAALLGLSAVPICAFGGAVAATALVYGLSRRGGRVPVATLLLTGIAVGSVTSALASLLLVVSPGTRDDLHVVVFWAMGSLAYRGQDQLAMIAPYVAVGLLAAALMARDLNALALGEETAAHLGVNVERVKVALIVVASLLAAGAVALAGIIGFVGLIVPHIMRLLVGPDHRVLLPASALGGAVLLALADLVARTAAAPTEIPVGIVTSVLGGPFFLYLLHRRRQGQA